MREKGILSQVNIDTDELLANVGPKAIQTLLVVVGAVILWLILRAIWKRSVRRVDDQLGASDVLADRERAQRLVTLIRFGWYVTLILLVATTILVVMAVWGIPIAPILAAGTVVGVAIGFGAQDVVKDILAGIFILAEDQYVLGDVVNVGGVSGTVEKIRLRTTVLRGLDGAVHHVPNGQIRVASNLTPDFSRLVVDLSVGYREDPDRVIEVLADELEAFAGVDRWSRAFLEPPQVLGVNELGESAVIVRLLFTIVPEERWAVKREFLRRIKLRLDRENIEIPFQYLNVVHPDDQT
jgi:small-conductance mechanosensitive channel